MARGECTKGAPFYLRMLACIQHKHATTDNAMAQELASTWRIVADNTKLMWAAGLIHPASWVKAYNVYAAVWAIGPGPGQPHPKRGVVVSPRQRVGIEMLAFRTFWTELQHPVSASDLIDATGYAPSTLYGLLVQAKKLKLARIGSWIPTVGAGDHSRLYVLGAGRDARRPESPPHAEHQRAYRKRLAARHDAQRLMSAASAMVAPLQQQASGF